MARVLRFVRLEMEEGTSSKFHEQTVSGPTPTGLYLLQAVWGRIGTPGTSQKVRRVALRSAARAKA
jgi:hypothetical protein